MNQHPLSSAFPAMSTDEYHALKDSIARIGVQEPITIYEGMVLDGWHRYTAAKEVGIDCPAIDLSDVDPQDFVIAKNKTRRHITASQIALAVAAVYGWKPPHREKVAPGATLLKSNAQLADIAGVSERTIRQAKTVEAKATPDVKAAVKAGTMSVKAAATALAPAKPSNPSDPSSSKPSADPGDETDHGADFDALAELEESNAELTKLRKIIEADDKAADALRWRSAYDVAQRRSDEHLRTIAARDARITFLSRQLTRCGKAVGESDTDKIAPAVERLVRDAKAAA